jgi:hypothetical protein
MGWVQGLGAHHLLTLEVDGHLGEHEGYAKRGALRPITQRAHKPTPPMHAPTASLVAAWWEQLGDIGVINGHSAALLCLSLMLSPATHGPGIRGIRALFICVLSLLLLNRPPKLPHSLLRSLAFLHSLQLCCHRSCQYRMRLLLSLLRSDCLSRATLHLH